MDWLSFATGYFVGVLWTVFILFVLYSIFGEPRK